MLFPRSIVNPAAFRAALRPSHGLAWRGFAAAAKAAAPPPPTFEYDVDRLHDTDYLGLPKLPLPPVNETITRYLETVRPLTTDEEFAETSRMAKNFLASSASRKIQEELKAMDDAPGYPFSYVEKYWDDMYLGGRWPIMVNSNPFYLLNDDPNPARQAQVPRAAQVVSAMTRFWTKVVNGDLEADSERGVPLCMYQYNLLFGGMRMPRPDRDEFIPNPHSKHIVVIHKHIQYKVEVIDDDGLAVPATELEAQFAAISMNQVSPMAKMEDIGVFTSGERNGLARRKTLICDISQANIANFEVMDSCLFVLVLEDKTCADITERSKMALHGTDGTNRWFDKHSVILDAGGSLMMNFEHSASDGLTWNRMLHEVWHDMHKLPTPFSPLPAEGPGLASVDPARASPHMLEWDLSMQMKAELEEERIIAKGVVEDLDTGVLVFKEWGNTQIKKWGFSPDAFAQMAMQLAYYRTHEQTCAPTYEACSMKNWLHGRTETIRSCSSDSKAMCEAFSSPTASATEKVALLRKAAETHVKSAKGAKAASGTHMGVDRHLYALRLKAAEMGIVDSIEFFEDPVLTRTATWLLSTSNVATPYYDLFGFGAVASNGYGIGYQTLPESVPFNVTSFKSNEETDTQRFIGGVTSSMKDFQDALEEADK